MHSCFPVNAGEHEHTIVGYSLVKGIGDGEPIASERFVVGGHDWVSSLLATKTTLISAHNLILFWQNQIMV